MFGVVFPDRSFPLDVSSFTQMDPLHWILDMSTFVPGNEGYLEVKEMCIFLLGAASLPPGKALAVYVQSNSSSPFAFCGAVHSSRPSAVLSLPWPEPSAGGTGSGRIGVSVEDLASLPEVSDAGREQKVEKVAMKVGENLFNFMQSFCAIDGTNLVVPMDILNRWFLKFRQRARLDPLYLKSFTV